jgi:hypothetical protein
LVGLALNNLEYIEAHFLYTQKPKSLIPRYNNGSDDMVEYKSWSEVERLRDKYKDIYLTDESKANYDEYVRVFWLRFIGTQSYAIYNFLLHDANEDDVSDYSISRLCVLLNTTPHTLRKNVKVLEKYYFIKTYEVTANDGSKRTEFDVSLKPPFIMLVDNSFSQFKRFEFDYHTKLIKYSENVE